MKGNDVNRCSVIDTVWVFVVNFGFQSNSPTRVMIHPVLRMHRESCPYMRASNYRKYLCPPFLNRGAGGEESEEEEEGSVNGALFGLLQSLDKAPLISPLMCVSHHKAFSWENQIVNLYGLAQLHMESRLAESKARLSPVPDRQS